MAVPANQSLYVQNLPEKLPKQELRRALYTLFSTYGPVLDITALRTPRMRGQAHVLFRDAPTATQALRACQGVDFFGKQMKIAYSTNRSDTLAKLTATFNPPATAADTSRVAPGQPPAAFAPLPGAPPTGLPPPPAALAKVVANGEQSAPSPQGFKRKADESDEEGGSEDDEAEDEGAMEMSDEDD